MDLIEKARKDPEMDRWLLASIFKPGQTLLHFKDEKYNTVTFLGLAETYYGRLANPGTEPGKYSDHTKAKIRNLEDGVESIVPIEYLTVSTALGNNLYGELIKELPDTWYLIDLSRYRIEDLPETKFMESDIVRLVDEQHPNYSKYPTQNQFTVYRINYSTGQDYKIRAGKVIADATEDQLVHAADGPIKIHQTQQHPLSWRSLKDEAEFHLLIGQYSRIFNEHIQCYKWDLDDPIQKQTAFEMLGFGTAHGLLKRGSYHEVVTFHDHEVGRQVLGSGLILDI